MRIRIALWLAISGIISPAIINANDLPRLRSIHRQQVLRTAHNSHPSGHLRLAQSHGQLPLYRETLIVGSGYGAAVSAYTIAQKYKEISPLETAAGSITLLDRGREWMPGDYPENLIQLDEVGGNGVGRPSRFIRAQYLPFAMGCDPTSHKISYIRPIFHLLLSRSQRPAA